MNTSYNHNSSDSAAAITRRHFFSKSSAGLGSAVLANLLGTEKVAASASSDAAMDGVLKGLHHAPKAKRVIYLFMSGGPSQIDMWDHKPLLRARNGEELPAEVRMGQRLTSMSGNQASLPLAGSIFDFKQYGANGTWVSDLLPHTAKVVDELCLIRSMHTEAINHDPAITFFQTGSQIAGRPSIGAWLSYGLGTSNHNLPTFCVLVTKNKGGQPLYARLWGSGFLPSVHQGVQFRPGKNPVLYLNNPSGISAASRRNMLDHMRELHQLQFDQTLDPAISARIAQYEMAYRMQTSVPEVADLSEEPDHIFDMYGPDSRNPGTFAANCLLARKLAEKDVRFIQLFHRGWDQHSTLPNSIKVQCQETDQPCAALIQDLKQRGMLEDTLVIWGGEFGRTSYSQGKLTATDYGRDHHPRCFTMWMAGGGIKPGLVYGETDPFSYNIVDKPVHVHDLHATILHQLGIDHERLTYKFQGRRYRLTDVHGNLVNDLLT
ncbi:DUF1501 domain-containing protein [Bythopirellula goksoeyrii]|uniref:Sulfatase n=1 Tax=Bythopirellula goksoeyrii TaxID=1400387 RepID=A0A5B9QJZ1_9BACT|nr:DUF1501 domain-containing protein [Bythopirellula goksoeyrii]QEG34413.1 hypothetical protein Pr1d_16920 [Bythopirellula goksoeyrii]